MAAGGAGRRVVSLKRAVAVPGPARTLLTQPKIMSDSNSRTAGAACRIGFIGAGRVGLALSRALARCGESVVAAWSRSGASAAALAAAVPGCAALEHAQDVIDASHLVFLSVPDDAIAAVAASVHWRAGMAAVHCSGAAELAVLDAARREGAHAGGFHPLQMFADPEVAAAALAHCAIAIDADAPLAATLERLVGALGSSALRVPPGQHAAYHAASHYAAAFLCVLLAHGESIFERIGIDRQAARRGLLALARGALDATQANGPAAAMAGAYSRGDVGTAQRHVAALQALGADFLPLYRTLALESVSLAVESGRLDPARAAALRAALEM
jgi:predicted short-subunit dehydrogenase-like oxidoreductase (DUF2520 family)